MQTTVDAMKGMASGTSGSHQRISPDDILDIDLIVPDENILIKYDSIIRTYFQKAFFNLQESQSLSKIRNLLLPKIMSGEIKV